MDIDLKPKTTLLQWSDEDVLKILKQYDRKPQDLKADVAIIREWLKTQPHLPLQPTDFQIFYFLLLSKFSFEKAKSKIEMNYIIKSIDAEFFSIPPKDPRIEQAINANNFVVLANLDKNCNRIVIGKCQDPDTFNLSNFFNYIFLTLELRTSYDISNSDDYILDMQNINLTVISKVNFVQLKKSITICEKVYSIRINAIHVINLPPIAESFLNLILALLKEKIRGRVYVHKSVEGLWEFYPKDILPKEYGGTRTLAEINREWLEFMRENNDYFEGIQNARIVESLRPQKLENDEILGYHGNFRKLQID